MNQNHAKAIKGMSIANIVLAALGILGCLCMWALIGMSGAAANSYSSGGYLYLDDGYYMDMDALGVALGMGSALIFVVVVLLVLVLIAGIIGLRGADNPEKLKGVMVWNIVGAVAAFFGAGLISTVLCIIVAVFASKDKQMAMMGGYAAPTAAYNPYAAPVAPQQPMAPAAMVPQQPVDPVPVASPSPAPAPAAEPVAPAPAPEPAAEAAPVTPTQPVPAEAVTPTQPAPSEPSQAEIDAVAHEAEVAAEHAADPALVVPDNYIEDATADTTIEVVEEDKPQE